MAEREGLPHLTHKASKINNLMLRPLTLCVPVLCPEASVHEIA